MGFHGKDVDQIIRDLVDVAINMTKKKIKEVIMIIIMILIMIQITMIIILVMTILIEPSFLPEK